MSSNNIAIKVINLGKCYEIYSSPGDRLKQFILPRLRKMLGKLSRHYFREFWALKDISFEIKKGETVGIIGKNGSGKSTLLQMVCGTLTPTDGYIQTSGRVAALLELGSGFNPEFTGRENVYMNASVLGLTHKEIDARFNDIVIFADIGEFIDQPVKTYSSGMYVRLAFAVIAHVDADILVIDEALAVGDVFFTQKCMRFLRNFMKSGTVLFVSHDTASIKSLCSHVIWLEKGRIVQSGAPKDVCESYLEAIYEAQQGKSTSNERKLNKKLESITPVNDQRSVLAFTDRATIQNGVQVISFNPNAPSFGKGGVTISNVYLVNEENSPMTWIIGGELATLKIEAQVNFDIESVIIGFFVKDRLGQMLFGDNTYLEYKDSNSSCKLGDEIHATFVFNMPWLPAGDYSVTISIATGTQLQHEQQHWIHDALVFRSNSIRVCNGLIGIPILKLNMEILHPEEIIDEKK